MLFPFQVDTFRDVKPRAKNPEPTQVDEARVSVRIDRQTLRRFYTAAAAVGENKRTAFATALREYAVARFDFLVGMRKPGDRKAD